MSALLFIVKNNMKKRKGDVITLFVLTVLSVFMLYSSISVMTGLGSVQDKYHEENNDADLFFWTEDKYIADFEQMFVTNEHITQYELSTLINSDIDYRKKGDSEWGSFTFLFGAYNETREINKLDFDASGLGEDDILLPFNMSNDFSKGDTIEFKIDNDVYDFRIAGFVTDAFFSSTINFSIYNAYINSAVLAEMVEAHPETLKAGHSIKALIDDPDNSNDIKDEVENSFKKWVGADNSRLDASWLFVSWEEMKPGNAIFSNLVSGVILVFSILILVIALIVINFSIRNFIEKNLKNTGMLMANGYTTGQLMTVTTLENLLVSFAASLFGILLGILGTGVIGKAVSIILGLPWKEPVNALAALTASGITVVLITGISLWSSIGYKKTVVLDALRGGVHSHNFRKNHLPLEEASFSLPISLSLKDILGDKRRNIILFLIVVILTMSTNTAFSLFENFRDRDMLLDITGNELSTASVTGSREDYEEIASWPEVEAVNGMYNFAVTVQNGDRSKGDIAVFAYTDLSLLEHEMLVEGRLPESSNEVVVGGLTATKLHIDVGDIVNLEWGDNNNEYVVVGIDQKIMNYGYNLLLSDEGAIRLIGEVQSMGLYVYCSEGVTYDDIYDKLMEQTGDNPIDVGRVVDSLIDNVTSGITIICIAVTAVTLLVVVFVEHLLIKSKIIKNWKNYGINKALGFTSAQLRIQTMVSNIPTVLVGGLVGSLISGPATGKLTTLVFSTFGFRKLDMCSSPQWILVTLIGIVAIAMLTSLAVSRSIKKLQPVELLTEE